jgi:hypothetical protein
LQRAETNIEAAADERRGEEGKKKKKKKRQKGLLACMFKHVYFSGAN